MPSFFFARSCQLISLSLEKSGLLSLWEERKKEFEQCHELQVFMRDAEQIENWMAKQEVGTVDNDIHKLPSS